MSKEIIIKQSFHVNLHITGYRNHPNFDLSQLLLFHNSLIEWQDANESPMKEILEMFN